MAFPVVAAAAEVVELAAVAAAHDVADTEDVAAVADDTADGSEVAGDVGSASGAPNPMVHKTHSGSGREATALWQNDH